jgi:hypothetical protein
MLGLYAIGTPQLFTSGKVRGASPRNQRRGVLGGGDATETMKAAASLRYRLKNLGGGQLIQAGQIAFNRDSRKRGYTDGAATPKMR